MALRATRDVAAAVRGRRKELGLTQAELAARARVSRRWIYQFESGKATAELGLVIRVLEQLGLTLEVGVAKSRRRPARTVDLDDLLKDHRES